MIKSRRKDQFRIVQIILSPENNPMTWGQSDLMQKTDNEKVIGYLFKQNEEKFGVNSDILNLYVIPNCRQSDEIIIGDLKRHYTEWFLKRAEKPNARLYKNPPLEEWLNTKAEWINKVVHRYANQFEKDFNDILSIAYTAIIKCHKTAYIGNLNYVAKAIYCEICLDLRYNKNKITCDSPNTISLDSIIDCDEGSPIVAATLGEDDARYNELEFEQIKQEILSTLKYTFSDREIEQILNADGVMMRLPNTLYRRLLRWREKHKRSDFNV